MWVGSWPWLGYHGESLAVLPGLAWMEIWVGASKVSYSAFFIVYYQPRKDFSVLEEEGRDQI